MGFNKRKMEDRRRQAGIGPVRRRPNARPALLVMGYILVCARRWDADAAPRLVLAKCAGP
jgi:hypothetical protein